MSNHLIDETSPYLLQHAENPVDWYPWGEEAFEKAKREDKPIFLSIGYSTCHWCHVMAHESFEDNEIAELLNRYYVAVKVDKEERPDIDSIYMAVCQRFTGSGGWPTSIFMTPEQKPFFAGTYFPRTQRNGSVGLKELLVLLNEKWRKDRRTLLRSADKVIEALGAGNACPPTNANAGILEQAVELYAQNYDERFGGFGSAPKFPTPHNLLFLMQRAQKHGDDEALKMAEKTLLQMYKGGMFDHIGYGFCRYSTDRYFLVPHFEKMLYDNALLIIAYCRAYEITKKPLYKQVAEKTAAYILAEMTSADGGFFSAQDADSDGEEGKFYVFTPEETVRLLGKKDGEEFNRYFGIRESGNFEGKSIPNLLNTRELTDRFDALLPKLREYRKRRAALHTDDKILTSWNALMIAAFCSLYRVTRNCKYLNAARRAQSFIEEKLCDGDTLYVSFRNGKRSEKGFLDDYAGYAFALLALYDATLEHSFLSRAEAITAKAIRDFYDKDSGGFYLYGSENETLIIRPKESYDGAIPSGNSLMAHDLVRLSHLVPNDERDQIAQRQLDFMSGEAESYPAGYAMFLTAFSDHLEPPDMITVAKANSDDLSELPLRIPLSSLVRVLPAADDSYPLINGDTTFYVCSSHSCQPPMTKRELFERLGR